MVPVQKSVEASVGTITLDHREEHNALREVVLEIVARWTELDVNGHVNNVKYLEYLEWGRHEWCDRHGFDYDRLKNLGVIAVVVNVNLNYRQPCHQGDRLRVVTWPRGRGRTSFTVEHRIERADGTAAAEGVITLVTVDPHTRRAVPLPEEFARLLPARD
jgi:thioesterase III